MRKGPREYWLHKCLPADRELPKQAGEVGILIGQCQTAQVLYNLCYQVCSQNPEAFEAAADHIRRLFGVDMLAPNKKCGSHSAGVYDRNNR
jgi:hypothetical protein